MILDTIELTLENNPWIIYALVVWVLPWKGWALWKAARNNQKYWFISLLVVNTLAVLEILYIFYFSKKKTGVKKA